MERALAETVIEGVNTTIEQCLEILGTEQFRSGKYTIDFLPSLMATAVA
jgi:biotin carboxylase